MCGARATAQEMLSRRPGAFIDWPGGAYGSNNNHKPQFMDSNPWTKKRKNYSDVDT